MGDTCICGNEDLYDIHMYANFVGPHCQLSVVLKTLSFLHVYDIYENISEKN